MTTSTISRMAPGEAEGLDAVQGWAITDTGPSGGTEQPFDLLFVHGMASSGTIWDSAWRAGFAAQGYRSWTITLPGRKGGGSIATNPQALDRAIGMALQGADPKDALDALLGSLPGMPLLDGPGLDQFTDAIETSLDRIDRPTVVVAHSLGGAATQNLLRRGRRPAGTVLMGSVPPYGLWRASWEMAWTNPDLYAAMADFSLAGLTPQAIPVMRANLFPEGISDEDFDTILSEFTDESLRAMVQAQGFPPFAPLPGPRRDILVLGGAMDRLIPTSDVWGTALYYGTTPTILPGAGHVMMKGPGAPLATDHILRFLTTLAQQD